MKTLDQILNQLRIGQFEFSLHAFNRAVERNISDVEITQAANFAKIIEDYPEDKYVPSCLLWGFTLLGRPLHMQVPYLDTPMVKIITIYEPDPAEWNEYSDRR